MNSILSLIALFSAQAQALGAESITALLSNRTVMIIVGLLFVAAALVMWAQGCKCCGMSGDAKHRHHSHTKKKASSKSPVRSASKSSANTSSSSLRRSPRKSKATF
jgi:hypothetical protein